MTLRVGFFFAILGLLFAQPQERKTNLGDDVAAYLADLRGPGVRRMNMDILYRSANASLASGQYAEAEAIFRNLTQQESPDSRGVEGVARVYLAQTERRKLSNCWKRSLHSLQRATIYCSPSSARRCTPRNTIGHWLP